MFRSSRNLYCDYVYIDEDAEGCIKQRLSMFCEEVACRLQAETLNPKSYTLFPKPSRPRFAPTVVALRSEEQHAAMRTSFKCFTVTLAFHRASPGTLSP